MNKELLEKLKTYLNKTKAAMGKVSKKVWFLAAVALVVLAAGITIFLNTRPYSIFITGATNEELSTAMSWLRAQGVNNYRMEGDTITVPSALAYNLKASWLTSEAYQSGTYKHDYFFNQLSALSTEAERNAVSRFDLQEELRAMIRSFDGVQDAVVIISTGEDMRYVLDSGRITERTASVKVIMMPGRTLDTKIALAIRNLVASGIQGLTVESVFITDNYGNTYNALSSDDYISTSAMKTQLEEYHSNKFRNQIGDMLYGVYGTDNVQLTVNTVVAVQNQEITDHDVHIPEYIDGRVNGQGIIGSRLWSYRWGTDSDEWVGGIVGTTSNSDIDIPNVVENPNANYEGFLITKGDGQTDYDNPYTDTHTYVTASYVQDVTATVYFNSTNLLVPIDIEATRRAVATAIGITPIETETMTADQYLATKITIISTPFITEPVAPGPGGSTGILPGIPDWVIYAAAAGVLLFILLLILILVIARRRRRKREKEEAEALAAQEALERELAIAAANAALAGKEPMGADVMALQTEKSMELRQDIRRFVEENPEVAARLVSGWLKGGDDNG